MSLRGLAGWTRVVGGWMLCAVTLGLLAGTAEARIDCVYGICPSNTSVAGPFTGGGGYDTVERTVHVTDLTGCGWTASTQAGWINVKSGASGVGAGTVVLEITNDSVFSRSATVTIATKTYTVYQGAADTLCFYVLTPPSRDFAFPGGAGSFDVSVAHGCSWAPVANEPWITISNVVGYGVCGDFSTDGGPGTVTYAVASNPGPGSRTGTITSLGFTHTIHQAAPPLPVTASIGPAAEISWDSYSNGHYVVQWKPDMTGAAWKGASPMVVSPTGGPGAVACSPQGYPQGFFRILSVTNRYCNEGHTAVGHWKGTAFADNYHFLPDGTVTGNVYQNTIYGTWLPLTTTSHVFAVYDRDTGGQAHPGGPFLNNPIWGTVDGTGTNMDFFVTGEAMTWTNYAHREP